MKSNLKYILITVLVLIIALSATFVYALNQGCCMEPECEECYEEWGFCICEFIEDIGLEECEECEEHGCGIKTGITCEEEHD